MSNQWLQDLKVGDRVIVKSRHNTRISKVSKVTPKQLGVGTLPVKFNKDNGWLRGGDAFCMSYLFEATPEAVETIRKESHKSELYNKVTQFDFSKLLCHELQSIVHILDAANESEELNND